VTNNATHTDDYRDLDARFAHMLDADRVCALPVGTRPPGMRLPAASREAAGAGLAVALAPTLAEFRWRDQCAARDAERAALAQWRQEHDPRRHPAGWVPERRPVTRFGHMGH